MAKNAFNVYEWRIENFGCWDAAVHGECIASPRLVLRYDFQFFLRLGGSNGKDGKMMLSISPSRAVPSSGGDLSFTDSNGSFLCTEQIHFDKSYIWISTRLTFEEVAAKIKNNGDQLTLRVCYPSKKDHFVAVSTTLDVLNISMRVDPKSIESLESDDSKNISIIRYYKENELLMKAIRKDETIEFTLELLTKPDNAISIECQWSLQNTDKTVERNEENKYLFHYCDEPWTFSGPLNWRELVQKGITVLLNLKIINGDKIDNKLNVPSEITAVPKETVYFFDQISIKDSAPIKETVDSVTALAKDLMALYQDQKYSDFQLKCDNVTFPVHKIILSARSPVFDRLLSSDMKEAASGIVDIEDLDPSTLSRFLTYIYTGAVEEELQHDIAVNLYYAADKYQVPSLKKECSEFLRSNVSLSNVCDILSLAHKHGDDDLKLVAEDFVLENYNQVLASKEWGNLLMTEPVLVAETLTSFAAKSSLVKISP